MLKINDETNDYYYFTIKNLPELSFLGWLQCKKEAIINNDNNNNNTTTTNNNNDNNNNKNNNFQNALDDA